MCLQCDHDGSSKDARTDEKMRGADYCLVNGHRAQVGRTARTEFRYPGFRAEHKLEHNKGDKEGCCGGHAPGCGRALKNALHEKRNRHDDSKGDQQMAALSQCCKQIMPNQAAKYDLQINQFGKFRRRGPYTSIIDNNYILKNFGIYAEEKLYSYALNRYSSIRLNSITLSA